MAKNNSPFKVIGIDPGITAAGYGIVIDDRSALSAVTYGVVRTDPKMATADRIRLIFDKFTEVFQAHSPDACAIETLFFAKNPRSVFQMGQARGVLLLCASIQGVPVFEYSPLEVKQAVSGYGRAEKSQIQYMMKTILNLKELPTPADASDALALAVCHCNIIRMKRLTERA